MVDQFSADTFASVRLLREKIIHDAYLARQGGRIRKVNGGKRNGDTAFGVEEQTAFFGIRAKLPEVLTVGVSTDGGAAIERLVRPDQGKCGLKRVLVYDGNHLKIPFGLM